MLLSLAVIRLQAQSYWITPTNTTTSTFPWNSATNWSPASVPNAADAVVIFGNSPPGVNMTNFISGGTNTPFVFGTLISSNGVVLNGNGGQLNAAVSTGIPVINVVNSGSVWFYAFLGGTQGFNKTGNGELTFRYNGNNNPLTGPIIISGGDICLNLDINLGNVNNGITFSNNARLLFNPTTPASAILAATRTLTLACSAANLDVANTNYSLTIPGVIAESVAGSGLQKTDVGTLLLSGANTYTGTTKISGGTLSVSATNNLGASAANIFFDGGTLQVTGSTMTNFGHSVSFTSGKTLTLDVNNAGNTFAADQPLAQGSGGLTKAGAGALALSQANTYTGTTVVSTGTLDLVAGGSLAAGSSVSLADGTTFDVSGLGTYTLGSGATLTASTTGVAATIKGGSGGTINLGTRPITLNYDLLNPALVIATGNLSLGGQIITVNTSQPLGNGTYNLIQVTSGNLIHSGTFTAAGNATNGASGCTIGFTTNAGIAYVTLAITGSTNTTAFLGGSGLRGDYFNSLGFTNLVFTRADATVDFNWGSSPPVSGLGANYSVRWSGQVVPLYSETYTFQVTARTGARLWVNNKLLAARTVAMTGSDTISGSVALTAGQSYNLMLEYLCSTNNSRVQLAWSSQGQSWQVIPQSQLSAVSLATSDTGSILEEYWQGLAGTNLTTLTSNTNYPNHPSGRESLLTFESLAPNWTTKLGTRVSGWLVPLTNGNYTFAVAAADTAQLWLSTDAMTNNEQLIASLPSATGFRQFSTFASQQSVSIPLVGGQKYFIELQQKSSTNSSYYSVAWQPPSAAGFTVIPGDYLAPNGLHTAQPSAANLFDTLATGHPRLLTSPERFAWLKQCIASNSPAYVISAWQSLSNSAAKLLTNTVLATYNASGMAGAGQSIQSDVQALGTAYFVTGNTNFAERAWLDLSNACTLSAWSVGGNDGLGMGEMTYGVGLGYDWFYNYLMPARRNSLTNGMVTLGVNPSQGEYPGAWYVSKTANNWAMVFNCGASELAIALANDLPTLSQNLLNSALTSMASSIGHFTTDNGGYYEGTEYCTYGVLGHLLPMLAGIENSLDTLFSLDDTPGLDDSGFFQIYAAGPSGLSFDFSDSGSSQLYDQNMFWVSRRYNRPAVAYYHRITAGAGLMDILWYDGRGTNMGTSGYSPDVYFRGPTATTATMFDTLETVTSRTKWNDANASFVGFKASALLSHGHLDAGGFVFDANHHRWFTDFGYGNTSDTNYYSNWQIYLKRAEGNNTLVLNPSVYSTTDQILTGVLNGIPSTPSIIYNNSEPTGDQTVSIADLTPAYAFPSQAASRIWRGTKLFNNRVWLLVQDEIVSATGQNVWWFAHFSTSGTTWGVSADGSSVTLTNGSNRLWTKLLTPGASFGISNCVPLPTSPNPTQIGIVDNLTGYRKLALNFTGVTNSTIAVLMVPLLPGDSPPQRFPAVVPLANWATNDLSLLTNTPPVASGGSGTVTNNNFYNFDLRSLASDAATLSNKLFFTVSQVSTGSVALLADGHTAKYTPPTNYVGAATFNYTVQDQWMDPRLLFYFDFQAGNWTNLAEPNDLSGHWHDGTFDTVGTGVYSNTPTVPAALTPFLSQSARLVNSGTNGARLSRGISTAEWNLSQTNWTFTGWFRRESQTNLDTVFYIGNGNELSGTGDELELYCQNASGDLILQHWNSGNTLDLNITASGVVNTGVWNQVAVTFTTTNGTSGLVRLYFNGVQVGSPASVAWNLNQSLPVRFGAHADATSAQDRWLNGELAEIAMFKGALSAAEISSLTNRTVAQFGGGTATNSVTINVVSPFLPPVLLPITNRTIIAGATLSVASQASDPNVPAQTLKFALPTAPTNASINATSGVIGWRPAMTFIGTSNQFTVVVTNTSSLAATQSFWVGVLVPKKPGLSAPSFTAGHFQLTISGDAGPDYTIQGATNLAAPDWQTLFTTNAPVPPFSWTDTNIMRSQFFYRILLGP